MANQWERGGIAVLIAETNPLLVSSLAKWHYHPIVCETEKNVIAIQIIVTID